MKSELAPDIYDMKFEPFIDSLEGLVAELVETGDLSGLRILNGKVAICMVLGIRMLQDRQQGEGHC